MKNSLLFTFPKHRPVVSKIDLSLKIKSLVFLLAFLFSNTINSQITETFITSGTWVAPCDVTAITVEVWGGGGGGQGVAGNGNNATGGGGSGGGFVKTVYNVVAGTSYSFSVGRGGDGTNSTTNNGKPSWFINSSTILAVGGVGAFNYAANTTSSGSLAFTSGNIGGTLVTTYGGNGADSNDINTGGGGSSAGNENGNNAIGINGGAAPTNGFIGANGINGNWGDGIVGGKGAGGSGAKKGTGGTTWYGGKGGDGQIRITYTTALKTYCTKSFTNTRPITNVTFAGINNTTTNNIGGSSSEDFCIEGNVLQGTTVPVSLKGNTNENWTYYYRVFIDWNQDGDFLDADESYNIGTISNSSGTDSKTVAGSIVIPTTALVGKTRMRVIQKIDSYATACSNEEYGQAENYVLNVLVPTPCSDTPTGGTTTLSPNTGASLSAFVAAVSGDSAASGLIYQWQISDTETGGWSDILGQTNATANLTAVPSPSTTTYYRRKIICNSSTFFAYSSVKTFTTNSVTYCGTDVPTANNNLLYIDSFKFVGTLNDNPTAFISAGSGYSNFTTLTPVVKQQQGSVLNIVASAKGVNANNNIVENSGYWKAWVDFNADGVYSASELVYSLTKFSTESLTFGFVIPQATPIGKYRLRIKVSNTDTFNSCTGSSYGETEDYLFEVVADCSAKVNTASLSDVSRCGTGSVVLSATGTDSVSGNPTEIRWYANATGGSPLYVGNNYTTDDITENTSRTFYVEAFNGSCKSVFRIPVTATADPGPSVSFGTVPAFCAATTKGQIITAQSGKRTDVLLDEKFDAGLGKFEPVTENFYQNFLATTWSGVSSPYRPRSTTDSPAGPYEGLSPALSSGYFGGNFAVMNADYDRSVSLLNHIKLRDALDTRNLENLTIEFDLYYFTVITVADAPNYFSLDYSLDGETWVNLKTIYTPQGNPNIWQKISLSTLNTVASGNNLPANLLKKQNLRFRLSSFAFAKLSPKVFKESIAAVDNVKVFGLKDESSLFGWTSTTPGILFQENCSTPLGNAKSAKICIKPTDTQIEDNTQFSITAQATFTNGCPAVGTTIVKNDAKIYKTSASTDWNTSGNWLPNDDLVPDLTKCVTIKQPVILKLGLDGLAKNVTVETGGSLQIMAPRTLTINDFLKNNLTADKVIIESDANLIQQNAIVSNVGSITAKRNTVALRYNPGTVIDYVYWGSPVKGQITKGNAAGAFSPGTPLSEFLSYRESNDRFYETADLTFTPGRGYAVQAEGIVGKTYTFKGEPNNGDISYPIIRSPDSGGYVHGYNLVANPYPSNITFEELYKGNSDLIYNTAWFWTNNIYEAVQKGSGYNGNNYSVINGTGGVSSTYSTYSGNVTSNGTITVGQGFIVQAKTSGSLVFKNTYGPGHILRVGDAGVGFFKKGTAQKDRFWLNLTNPDNITNAQLIGYVEGATDGFEQDYDNEAFDDYSDLFYSKLNNMKLVIQGKSQNFSSDDRIQLGAIISQTGNYTIALDKAEGIFRNDQKIYLKDKDNGIVTDLSLSHYAFQATKGLSEGRFEIIYKPQSVLSTADLTKENLWIYREVNNFVVKSAQKILDVELYDYAGRLLVKVQPLSTSSKIAADSLPNGIYLLKIKLANGETITKKIRK